jgi:hypothetical protein
MSAHAYWRLYVSANNGDGYVNFSEIEMMAVAGGADQCAGGAAFGDGSTYDSPDNAFDNNIAVSHVSAGVPSWVGYHFASAVDIVEVSLVAVRLETSRAPKDFLIQWSDDGSAWTTTTTIVNQTDWAIEEKRVYSTVPLSFSGTITESLGITDWLVIATDSVTGALVGSTFSGEGGASYLIELTAKRLCNLAISPRVHYAWSNAKSASLGDYVVAVNPDATPHIWKCTTAGATHATTEPTWNLSGTTTDNTVTWTYIAPLVNPISLGCKIPV